MKDILNIMGNQGSRKFYLESKYIYFRGDPGNEFFVIEKGKVELSLFTQDGESVVIAELGPGEYFGQIEVFTHSRRTMNAYVHPKTTLVSFTAKLIREKILSNTSYAFSLISDLCNLLDKEYQHLEDYFVLNSYQRVSKKLFELSQKNCSEVIEINQERISNLLAISRETTNKSLNKLKRKGAIHINRSRIRILDNNLLQEQFTKMGAV